MFPDSINLYHGWGRQKSPDNVFRRELMCNFLQQHFAQKSLPHPSWSWRTICSSPPKKGGRGSILPIYRGSLQVNSRIVPLITEGALQKYLMMMVLMTAHNKYSWQALGQKSIPVGTVNIRSTSVSIFFLKICEINSGKKHMGYNSSLVYCLLNCI